MVNKKNNKSENFTEEDNHSHDHDDHEGHDHSAHGHSHNPLGSLDEETQNKIRELQMLEQTFQQLLMQKNAFIMELNETDYIISSVEKTSGEVSRIIGGQVVIKSTKDEVLKEMKKKKELLDQRMKSIDSQEKDFSKKIEDIREEVMKKIQG